MRARRVVLALLLSGLFGLNGVICQAPAIVNITSPTGDVTTASFTIEFEVQGFFTGLPEAFLNFQPLVVTQVAAREFTASVTGGPTMNPGSPLQDNNLLIVKAVRTTDGAHQKRILTRSAVRRNSNELICLHNELRHRHAAPHPAGQ